MKYFHAYRHGRLQLGKLIHSDLWRFDFSIWLQTFARSMVGIFLPILLLQLDYSVREVMLFFLYFNIIDVPLNFIARNAVKRLGAHRTIIIGNVAIMLFYLLFTQLTLGVWYLLLLLSLLLAIFDTFYWVAHLFIFMEVDRRKKDTGKDTGILEVMRQFGKLLGPIIGAVLLVFVGAHVLLFVAALLLFIAMLPLNNLKHVPQRPNKAEMPLASITKDKPSIRDNISEILTGTEASINDILWPMFIYVSLGTVESVAWLAVIISLSAMIFSYVVGSHATKYRVVFSFVGAAILALVWFGRVYSISTLWIYASVIVAGLFRLFFLIPLESSTYMRSKYVGPLQAATYRNFFGMLPNVILFSVFAVISNVFTVGFVIAATSMLCLALLNIFFRPQPNKAIQLLK